MKAALRRSASLTGSMATLLLQEYPARRPSRQIRHHPCAKAARPLFVYFGNLFIWRFKILFFILPKCRRQSTPLHALALRSFPRGLGSLNVDRFRLTDVGRQFATLVIVNSGRALLTRPCAAAAQARPRLNRFASPSWKGRLDARASGTLVARRDAGPFAGTVLRVDSSTEWPPAASLDGPRRARHGHGRHHGVQAATACAERRARRRPACRQESRVRF